MGKFSKVIKSVSKLLGMDTDAPTINIPKAELPAEVSPTNVEDANVSLGTGGSVENQRVSGRSTARKKTSKSTDILGGLGQSGLNI